MIINKSRRYKQHKQAKITNKTEEVIINFLTKKSPKLGGFTA